MEVDGPEMHRRSMVEKETLRYRVKKTDSAGRDRVSAVTAGVIIWRTTSLSSCFWLATLASCSTGAIERTCEAGEAAAPHRRNEPDARCARLLYC